MSKPLVISEEKENDEQHLIQLTMNVVNEEKDDRIDTTSVDKIEIQQECNHNIYNAFLIAYYRDDPKLKLKEHDVINKQIKYGLGMLAYLTAISQCAALIFLIRVVMITSGVKIWDLLGSGRTGYAMFMWPFWFIAIIVCLKESQEATMDIKVLKEWNITSIISIDDNDKKTCTCKWKNIHVFFLKIITEQILGYVGSLVYFFVIAIYSSDDKWDGIINTIFNLLAYQFILDADEWAYSVVRLTIKLALAETSPQIDIKYFFSGHVKDDKIYISKERKRKSVTNFIRKENWISFSVFFVLMYSVVLQGLYSRGIVLVGVILLLFLGSIVSCICLCYIKCIR
eukprot:285297_1